MTEKREGTRQQGANLVSINQTETADGFNDSVRRLAELIDPFGESLASRSHGTDAVGPEGDGGDSPIMGAISVGRTNYRVHIDGHVEITANLIDYVHGAARPGDHDELIDAAVVDGIPIPAGVTVLFGGPNTGKSPILRYIAERSGATLIRHGEPLPGYLRHTRDAVRDMLMTTADVIALDSIKNQVGRLEGGLMTSGMAREIFPMLSDWSSYFAERGQAVVTVLNVSNPDPALAAAVIDGLHSNTTSTWHVGRESLQWQARVGEGKRRRSGSASIVWQGDGVVARLVASSSRIGEADRQIQHVIGTAGDTAIRSPLSRRIERAISNARSTYSFGGNDE